MQRPVTAKMKKVSEAFIAGELREFKQDYLGETRGSRDMRKWRN